MNIPFFKYHGTGNDFILVDNRRLTFPKNDTKVVASMCDRHFGIGGDGLILIEEDSNADFNMVYFNSDGNEGSLCGNGARCAVAYAKVLGMIEKDTVFRASDGLHTAELLSNGIRLKMQNLKEIKEKSGYYFLDTGSPHHVQLVENLQEMDIEKEGARLRYGLYGAKGSNINFVSQTGDSEFAVRTYERGVENETLSCGTGVTAVALAMHKAGKTSTKHLNIVTKGGKLSVQFTPTEDGYEDIFLEGPVALVFKGEYSWLN